MERVGKPVDQSRTPFCALIEYRARWVNTRRLIDLAYCNPGLVCDLIMSRHARRARKRRKPLGSHILVGLLFVLPLYCIYATKSLKDRAPSMRSPISQIRNAFKPNTVQPRWLDYGYFVSSPGFLSPPFGLPRHTITRPYIQDKQA